MIAVQVTAGILLAALVFVIIAFIVMIINVQVDLVKRMKALEEKQKSSKAALEELVKAIEAIKSKNNVELQSIKSTLYAHDIRLHKITASVRDNETILEYARAINSRVDNLEERVKVLATPVIFSIRKEAPHGAEVRTETGRSRSSGMAGAMQSEGGGGAGNKTQVAENPEAENPEESWREHDAVQDTSQTLGGIEEGDGPVKVNQGGHKNYCTEKEGHPSGKDHEVSRT